MANNPNIMDNIRDHQWPKGVSGNPAGKPKGTRSIITVLRELLEKEGKFDNAFTGMKETMAVKDALGHQLIKTASKDGGTFGKSSQLKSIDMIMERIHGKPKQVIETIDIPINDDEARSRLERIASDEGMSYEDLCEREGIEQDG